MATDFLETGGIRGNSKTFSRLPYCSPDQVAAGALKAALRGRAMYTPRALYKLYRVLSKLLPAAVMVKLAKV